MGAIHIIQKKKSGFYHNFLGGNMYNFIVFNTLTLKNIRQTLRNWISGSRLIEQKNAKWNSNSRKFPVWKWIFFAVSSYAIIEEITLAIFLGVYETRTYVWKCAEILKYSLI